LIWVIDKTVVPQLDGASLDHAVNATAERAVDEHLAMSGFLRA